MIKRFFKWLFVIPLHSEVDISDSECEAEEMHSEAMCALLYEMVAFAASLDSETRSAGSSVDITSGSVSRRP